MTPIKTNLCNFTYTAPAGMTAEQCGDLHCHRDLTERTVTSYWKPEPEESAAIASGGLVMLTCHGLAHPPVAIGACTIEDSDEPADEDSATIRFLYAENARIEKECGEYQQFTHRSARLLREAWAAMRDIYHRMETIRETNPEIALSEDMKKLLDQLPHIRTVEYTWDDVMTAQTELEKQCPRCHSRMAPAIGHGGSIYHFCPTQEKHVQIGSYIQESKDETPQDQDPEPINF